MNSSIHHHEQNSDKTAAFNISPIYPRQFPYNPYLNDSTSMFYNSTYPHFDPSTAPPMNFSSYGYFPTAVYATNNYNAPLF